jgi:hypothetical protein
MKLKCIGNWICICIAAFNLRPSAHASGRVARPSRICDADSAILADSNFLHALLFAFRRLASWHELQLTPIAQVTHWK